MYMYMYNVRFQTKKSVTEKLIRSPPPPPTHPPMIQRVHRVVSADEQRCGRGPARLHHCPQEFRRVSLLIFEHALIDYNIIIYLLSIVFLLLPLIFFLSGLRTRIDEYVSLAHPDSAHTGSVGGASPRDSQHPPPQIENHMCKWRSLAI